MGKRKRAEQTYSKKHHANNPRRAGPQRPTQHDFFSIDSDGPDYEISSLFGQPSNRTKSSKPASLSTTLANRPSTRTTKAMPAEPSEDDVQMLVTVTSCSRETSVRYLKAKNNNVESAMNALLDGEDISKQETASQWDEGVWQTDRDGNANIGERDLRPLGTGTSTAPTRVPSPAGDLKAPTNRDAEDAELARALEMSQQDLGSAFQQESGVVGADGTSRQTFGPATKDQYDKNDWAMVPFSLGASSEIVPDVEPEQRKNVEGEPRFLKNLPSGDYLPNFLTIGHAIPAVRESLLFRECTMAQYGEDPEWWKGNQIALPKIVHTEDGAPADPEIDRFDEFIAETQRLMAVLDASQRSYASALALSQTELLRSGDGSGLIEKFIKRTIQAATVRCGKAAEYLSLFATNIDTTSPEGLLTPYLEVFDMPIKTVGEDKLGLMEILDGLLWDTVSEDAASVDNSIVKGADVLVMCANQTNPSAEKLQIDVPPTLYIDKYLGENLEISKPARLEILQQKQRVAKITDIENKLTKWEHPQKKGEDLDARAMLQHTLGHFSGKNMADATNADRENGIVVNGTDAHEQPHYAEIASRLEAIALSVDKKLEKLAAEKEAIQKNISQLSNSSPPQLEERGLRQRYTLMGVATKPSITYVLRPKEEEDEDEDRMSTETDADDSTPDGMQWWRIEYTVNSNSPRILKSKVAEYTVLHAVEAEHTSALLVYASDRAVDDSISQNLPPPLHHFVQEDDAHFTTELRDATLIRPPPSYEHAYDSEVPRQSIEPGDHISNNNRRASADSTCAQGGSPTTGGSPFYGGSGAPQTYGLPPSTVRSGQHVESASDDPEVTEIHLSPPQEEETQHQEMVETRSAPFLPGLKTGQQHPREREEDASMEDVRNGSGDDGAGRRE